MCVGSTPKAPAPPPPEEAIKQPGRRSGSREDQRNRQRALAARRNPSAQLGMLQSGGDQPTLLGG